MPYIKKENRPKLDWMVANLAAELSDKGVTGNLNYFLFKLFLELKRLKIIKSYRDMSAYLAELECCKLELYRRPIKAYEVLKALENGDVE